MLPASSERIIKGDLFSEDAFTGRAIMTNDQTTSSKKLIDFYNKRGGSERLFDVMNNDFGWSDKDYAAALE